MLPLQVPRLTLPSLASGSVLSDESVSIHTNGKGISGSHKVGFVNPLKTAICWCLVTSTLPSWVQHVFPKGRPRTLVVSFHIYTILLMRQVVNIRGCELRLCLIYIRLWGPVFTFELPTKAFICVLLLGFGFWLVICGRSVLIYMLDYFISYCM